MSLERPHGLQYLDLCHAGELLSALISKLELGQFVHGAAVGVSPGVVKCECPGGKVCLVLLNSILSFVSADAPCTILIY